MTDLEMRLASENERLMMPKYQETLKYSAEGKRSLLKLGTRRWQRTSVRMVAGTLEGISVKDGLVKVTHLPRPPGKRFDRGPQF